MRVPNVRTHAWLDRAVDGFWWLVDLVFGAARAMGGDE